MTSEKAAGYDHCCALVEAFTKEDIPEPEKGRGFAPRTLRAIRDANVANQSE
jgi:hypothetical protein